MKKLIALLILFSLSGGAFAQKAMTRAEAIALLAKSAHIKKKETALFNWNVGYDISKVNRVRLIPIINYIRAIPKKVPPDGRTIIELIASVNDPGGPKNIRGVKADLSSIGKLPNMTLVDNGLWGDTVAGDGVYTLQTTVNPDIDLGDKEIPVTASNKKGWLAVSKTSIMVDKNPLILSAVASPDKVPAGSYISFAVRVDNPGRIEDVAEVIVDLREIGGGESKLQLVKDETFAQNVFIPGQAAAGIKSLPVRVTNLTGGTAAGSIRIEVLR
jgi:hypothetical protein